MAKFLINQDEAKALKDVVEQHRMKRAFDNLGYDTKKIFTNSPIRFKTLATVVAGAPNTVVSDLYFLGDEVGSTVNNYNVNQGYYEPLVDDTSAFKSLPVGTIGLAWGSSEFFITSILSAMTYMGLATANNSSDSSQVTIDNLEALDGIATTLLELTANNKFKLGVKNNGYCLIKWSMHSSSYELLLSDSKVATHYMGLTSTDFAVGSTGIFYAESLEPMDGVGTSLTQLVVTNKFAFPFDMGARCFFVYNEYTGHYELIQVECPIQAPPS
jgi:hypothetical protein